MTVRVADALLTTLRLVGECNRCGECCRGVRPDGVRWSCEHLDTEADHATRCAVYADRVDRMPIRLVCEDGSIVGSRCHKESPQETAAILPYLGGPCSLTLAPEASHG